MRFLETVNNQFKLATLQYINQLHVKYEDRIENRWIWIVVAMIVLAAIGLYAWYCTSRVTLLPLISSIIGLNLVKWASLVNKNC